VADLRKLCREVVLEYGDAITYVPDGMARKAAMLTATLGQLDRLSTAVGDDPAFRSEVGGLYARLADLQTVDNWNADERPDDAEHHARRAITLLASAGHANGADTLLWWARALCVLSKGAQHRREFDAALAHLAQAEQVVQTGLERFVSHPGLCSEHAAVVMIRASLHYGYNKPNLNQPDAALDVLEQAQAMYLAMTRGPGTVSMEDVFQVAAVAAGRALIFARQERWAQAIDASTQALAQRQQAGDMEPHNRVVQGAVAADHNLHCALLLTVGDVARALHHGQAAWVALQTLVAEDPGNRAWPVQQRNLALNLGRALTASGDAAGALPVLQLSADGLAAAMREGSATPLQRRRHAQTQAAQAGALHQLAQREEARTLATQAATALQALVQEAGAERDSFMALGECAVCLSSWHAGEQALDWKAQARSAYDQAEHMQPLTAEHARRANWARG